MRSREWEFEFGVEEDDGEAEADAVELDATPMELITVAAPVGWGRSVGMSAASFEMADMGGSGTGWTREVGKKLCFHRYRVSARAVRAPVAVERGFEVCSLDIGLETGEENLLVLFI